VESFERGLLVVIFFRDRIRIPQWALFTGFSAPTEVDRRILLPLDGGKDPTKRLAARETSLYPKSDKPIGNETKNRTDEVPRSALGTLRARPTPEVIDGTDVVHRVLPGGELRAKIAKLYKVPQTGFCLGVHGSLQCVANTEDSICVNGSPRDWGNTSQPFPAAFTSAAPVRRRFSTYQRKSSTCWPVAATDAELFFATP
jgi:hypothetical protein